jgi:hypothetical protein
MRASGVARRKSFDVGGRPGEGPGPERPKVAFGAFNAPKAAFGALDATKAALGGIARTTLPVVVPDSASVRAFATSVSGNRAATWAFSVPVAARSKTAVRSSASRARKRGRFRLPPQTL